MFKVGQLVSRKKYNNDIIFKIIDVKKDYVILHGVDIRLVADANIDDLVECSECKKKQYIKIRELDLNNYFYIPGKILHFDSDIDYLNRCMYYYKTNKIKAYGYVYLEKDYKDNIIDKIKKHNPDIVVITGHDSYNDKTKKYKNSNYYIDTVKEIRKYFNNINGILIVAGACQSDYVNLIKSGSNFASSPKRINIHCMDPAIIASILSLSDSYEKIDIKKILSLTTYDSDGFGGIITNGKLIKGFPRKETN